jgi:hypothetical protein
MKLGEGNDDLFRGTGRAREFECRAKVLEGDGVADDQCVSFPIRYETLGELKYLVGVRHAADDGDFAAHHVLSDRTVSDAEQLARLLQAVVTAMAVQHAGVGS